VPSVSLPVERWGDGRATHHESGPQSHSEYQYEVDSTVLIYRLKDLTRYIGGHTLEEMAVRNAVVQLQGNEEHFQR
jgi:hypothetical protein